MAEALTREGVAAIVREQIDEILAAPETKARYGLGGRFTAEHEDRLDWMEHAIRGFQNDYSLGRVFTGPTWLSGTSVMDGTITANKLIVNSLESVTINTGDLNITGTIKAAASFPATGARIEINSNGLWGYSGAATTTFKLNTNGSGEIGTGSNKITWNTSGVLTVPVAVISSLTIAEVGGGVFGGTYQSSANTTRFEISSTSFRALASGTETFHINATTGAVTATGSFTIQSATSGARVIISSAGGIEGKNSGGTTTFLLNAATGAGQLGTGTVSWNSSGSVTINGSVLVNGTVIANAITGGTINNGSGATVNLGSADVVVNSTGKLKFGASAADYLANDILHFTVSSSSVGKIEFVPSSGSYQARILAAGGTSASDMTVSTRNGTGVTSLAAVVLNSGSSDGATSALLTAFKTSAVMGSEVRAFANGTITFYVDTSSQAAEFQRTNRALSLFGRLYPGTGSSSQGSRYIYDASSNINIVTDTLYISGNSGQPGLRFTNIANGGSAAFWSSFTVANVPDKSAGYIKINIAGTNYRVAIWADG